MQIHPDEGGETVNQIDWSTLRQDPQRLDAWLRKGRVDVTIPADAHETVEYSRMSELLSPYGIRLKIAIALNGTRHQQIEFETSQKDDSGELERILRSWLSRDPEAFLRSECVNIELLINTLRTPLTPADREELGKISINANKAWELLQKFPITHPYPDHYKRKVIHALKMIKRVAEGEEENTDTIKHQLGEINAQIYGQLWGRYVDSFRY